MKNTLLIILVTISSMGYLSSQDNVGIGVTNPSEKLEVAGRIFSNAGGFKFPDSTIQITAAYNTQTSDAALPKLVGYLLASNIPGPVTRDLEFKDGEEIVGLDSLIPVYAHSLEININGTTPNFGNLHITTDVSISSPDIFKAVVTGLYLADVYLYLMEDKDGVKDVVYHEIYLEDAVMVYYGQNQVFKGDFQYAHLNSLSIQFEIIEISSYSVAGRNYYCWDVVGNIPCS